MTEAPTLPLDVRLMTGLSNALLVGAAVLAAGGLLAGLGRLPAFAIQGLRIEGDTAHYNAITLRANVLPRLQGTFFSLDLAGARQAFETLPWVRQAIVRRDFPNRLRVQLQEHQAVAFWGEEGDGRLLNSFGEVFDANVGELERDNLPRLAGPQAQSAQLLAMYQSLQPLFERLDLSIVLLTLSPRGGWHAELDSGTLVELGSGEVADVVARVVQFLQTATQVSGRFQRTPEQLVSVDLRHSDGFAVRLDGVTTQDSDGKKQ